MAWEAAAITLRIAGFACAEWLRGAVGRLERGPFTRWRWPGSLPNRFVVAPQDIRTTDPTQAVDIYSGIFAFAGKVVDIGRASPFDVPAPSGDWLRELHGFGWLRHLRAANTSIARANARALVADWIAGERSHPAAAFEGEVIARRLLSFIAQSPLILEDVDHEFYRGVLKAVIRHVRRLHNRPHELADGYPRLLAAIAVATAALSLNGQAKLVRQASQRLDQELRRQVLPDGGHASRNPGTIVDLLLDLLPLRRLYAAQGEAPPAGLVGAIDRMMPMVRFFRHADGSLGIFNGMGATPFDHVATVLAYDETMGNPLRNALASGYQRLDCGDTVVLMDTGRMPPIAMSARAHAGALSMEFGTSAGRIVVNCGTARDPRWRAAMRATAAHNTVIVEDTSSSRFLGEGWLARRLGPVVTLGPRSVAVDRTDDQEGVHLVARHDGYDDTFGLIHERVVRLSADGTRLRGQDRLIWTGAPGRNDAFAVRFHLHPGVSVEIDEEGGRLLLSPGGGEVWAFSTGPAAPELADSVHLCDVYGRRRALQIVIAATVAQAPRIDWMFERLPPLPSDDEAEEDLSAPELFARMAEGDLSGDDLPGEEVPADDGAGAAAGPGSGNGQPDAGSEPWPAGSDDPAPWQPVDDMPAALPDGTDGDIVREANGNPVSDAGPNAGPGPGVNMDPPVDSHMGPQGGPQTGPQRGPASGG